MGRTTLKLDLEEEREGANGRDPGDGKTDDDGEEDYDTEGRRKCSGPRASAAAGVDVRIQEPSGECPCHFEGHFTLLLTYCESHARKGSHIGHVTSNMLTINIDTVVT